MRNRLLSTFSHQGSSRRDFGMMEKDKAVSVSRKQTADGNKVNSCRVRPKILGAADTEANLGRSSQNLK